MPDEVTRPPLQMLRESLRADSPKREAAIARVVVACAFLAIPFVLALAFFQPLPMSLAIGTYLAVVGVYYVLLLRALERGFFHPALAWINVAIEVSVIPVILLITAVLRGPEYTLMTPGHVIWGALVVMSSLRARPALSLMAGILTAAEWLAIYTFLIVPQLPEAPSPSMRWPAAILRAVCLLMSSAVGIIFARHHIAKAEEALSAVREQDLMGKYFLHERLGAGGMAEVYRATYCPEGGFQKPVAIKRVLPSYTANPAFTEMFREEARLCALLAHPCIVQVFDCGRYRDSFILAMEYVDGLPLNRLLKRLQRPLPLNAVSYLGVELSRALDYIHRKVDTTGEPLRLVHRDVNPPNILISRIGEVKLGDFGVANAAIRAQTGRLGVFYGKLPYAAPEQLGNHVVDSRVDLFALGLTLNEAITGRPVYRREDEAALEQGIYPRVPRPSELRPDVPSELDALVMELCTIDRDQRIRAAAEVRARLSALQGTAAPFPTGQQALAQAIEEALAAKDAHREQNADERATEIAETGESAPDARFPARWGEGSHVTAALKPRGRSKPDSLEDPSSTGAQTRALRVKK